MTTTLNVFSYHGKHYPAVISAHTGALWLVMLDTDGQMETAFVVEQPEKYLTDPRFILVGKYQELIL